jgi:hypothetical protein
MFARAGLRVLLDASLVTTLLLGLGACASKPKSVMGETPSKVRETVQTHLLEVRKCYEDELLKTPMLEGKMVVDWTIDGAGKVVDAKLRKADPRIEAVAPCVLEKSKTWQFPPAPQGKDGEQLLLDVTYPFVFSENGKSPESLK